MNYLLIILSFLVSMVLAMIVIPKILVIAVRHSLYDMPNERKKHAGAVPRIGGVSFIPCILFSILFTVALFYMFAGGNSADYSYPNISEFCLFFCGLTLLYLGGVKDDLVGLRYRHKFTIQIIASLLLISSGLYLNDFHGLFAIGAIPWWIGIPFTLFVMVFIINAMNLIDGIDGLASGISIFALCIYGTFFLLHDLWYYAILAAATIGVLLPFFYYNVFGDAKRKRKLFMGDSGSLTLGFILGYLSLRYACSNPAIFIPLNNALIIALSPLLLPMLDVLRVILVRFKKHKHIFHADRSHIHHKLIDMGLNKSTALVVLLCLSLGLCILNFILMGFFSSWVVLLIDVVLWTSVNMWFSYRVRKWCALSESQAVIIPLTPATAVGDQILIESSSQQKTSEF